MGTNAHCRGADFCDEIAGDADTTFKRVYSGSPPSRRIATTESFVVIADLSPLTVGHLLLLPRDHHLSFAGAVRGHLAELREVLDWLIPRYRQTFGEPTLLEHGSTPDFDHSACITHAHWHVVPVAGHEIAAAMTADGLLPTSLKTISDIASWEDSAYFLVMYGDRKLVVHAEPRLRRQYLRSVISKPLHIPDPEWDYAVVVRKEYLRETIELTSEWTRTGSATIVRT